MIKQIKFRNTSYTAQTVDTPKAKPKTSGLYLNSLEYNMLANLVAKQYEDGDVVKYDALLSIPLTDRIPGLIERYGKKTMHKLLVMIIKEFCNTLTLPKIKRLTETKISIIACELMLTSYEDYLSLEDVILFLQRAKSEKYGAIKSLAQPAILFTMLEQYRQLRHDCYRSLKDVKEAELKVIGSDIPRNSSEPTAIGDLVRQGYIIDISTRKMSG